MNWKLLIMRTVLNGIIIALTALLLPGITVEDSSVVNYLLLGALFGILNALVKPVVQFFTLSLLFVSYGLIIILIHTAMLILLAFFSDLIMIDNIWWAVAGGILMGLLGITLENLFGLTPPIIDRTRADRLAKAKA